MEEGMNGVEGGRGKREGRDCDTMYTCLVST